MGINRIFGKRAGLALTATDADSDLGGGVYSMSDQYYAKQRGGWSSVSATGGTKTTYNGKIIHTIKATTPFIVAGDPMPVEYVIIGGGGSGGSSGTNAYGGGGGGAGQVLTGTTTLVGGTFTVTIGAGGAASPAENTAGSQGANTTCNFPAGITTAFGGGGGAACGPHAVNSAGTPGVNYPLPSRPTIGSGSGGGAGKGYASTTYNGGPAPLGAYPGGEGPQPLMYVGCGGGGAGGAGGDGPPAPGGVSSPNTNYGYGGLAKQLPSTFQDPSTAPTTGTPGPSGTHWVGGGGSGGLYGNPPGSVVNATKGGSGATDGTGPFGGGGNGGGSSPTDMDVAAAADNTGGGGGGAGADLGEGGDGGAGGSGMVLIAYSA